MATSDDKPAVSGNAPDEFDRLLGNLDGLPDVTRTRASTITVVPALGVGGSRTFIVQTYRQTGIGDHVFLQCVGSMGSLRIALPPSVAETIARQRDALTVQVRSKIATRTAADRKARGKKPGFKMTAAERAEARRERERKRT